MIKLGIYLAIAVAVVAVIAGVVYKVEHWCNIACEKQTERADGIKAAWDAAVAAQQKREAVAAQDAIDAAVKAKEKSDADFGALAHRNDVLKSRLAAIPVPSLVVSSVRDAIRTANSEKQSTGSATKDSAPITGFDLSQWAASAAGLYRACREQVIAWVKWDDERIQ
jgi:hypothetical protein